jgi:putative transposase
MASEPATYAGRRLPAEAIRHAAWLCHPFGLSLRDVELILAERGIAVTHESVRLWCLGSGADFARGPRRRRPRPGDTWHLGGVFLRMRGELHHLRRAADQHGGVLGTLVQDRRNAAAARRFFRRLLVGLKCRPRRIVTDGPKSCGVARREVLPDVRHRTSRHPGNRAGDSRRPTGRRERQMRRFEPPGHAQRVLPAHAMTYGHFRPRRRLTTASDDRGARVEALRAWRQETCARMAAWGRGLPCPAWPCALVRQLDDAGESASP